MCKIFGKKQSEKHEDYSACIEQVLLYIPESEYTKPLIRHDVLADILNIDAQYLKDFLWKNNQNDFDMYCLVQNGEYEWRIYRENFQLTMDMDSFVAITLNNIGIVEKLFASDEIKKKMADVRQSLENYNNSIYNN